MPDGFKLNDKVAVIVGGSTGIGARTAELFAEVGARVVVGDVAVDAGQERCEKIRAAGGAATFVKCDVALPADVEKLMAETVSRHGGIDVLFNNAATVALMSHDVGVAELDVEVWDEVLAVNLRGVMLGCKYAIPYMLARGGGSIVNTSSVRALNGGDANPSYGVSKIGVIGLTRYVATMYGRQGIRCNAIAPGWTGSEVALRNATDESRRLTHKQYLVPRLGRTDDVAKCALFLASEDSGYIQGHLVPVDGGVTAHLPYYHEGPPDLDLDTL